MQRINQIHNKKVRLAYESVNLTNEETVMQIEEKTSSGSPNPDLVRNLTILIPLTLVALFLLPADNDSAYFFAPRYYLYPLTFFFFLSMAGKIFGKRAISIVCGAIAATFFAYGIFETLYSWLPDLKPLIDPNSEHSTFWFEMISYPGNRGLQMVPITLLATFLFVSMKSQWRHRLRFGNPSVETTLTGQVMTWKKLTVRIAFYFLLVTAAFIAVKSQGNFEAKQFQLLSARIVGGATNSMIEELLFRGLLQPIFELALPPGAANLIQATFFSVIHFGYIDSFSAADAIPELIKLALFLLIGLFLGRAARETEGIFLPWLYHFIITSAIWLTLTIK